LARNRFILTLCGAEGACAPVLSHKPAVSKWGVEMAG
jgi:hypothetical protein